VKKVACSRQHRLRTTATAASVANFRKAGAEVVYSEVIDANAQDVSPNMLHARDAGAQAIACWSDSTGLDARMMNARGRIGWTSSWRAIPPSVPAMSRICWRSRNTGQGVHCRLRSCSYDANGNLPPRMAAFVDEVKGKVELQDTLLWWVTAAVDAVTLVAEAVSKTGSSDSDKIIAYWNSLSTWPGLFGDYAFSPKEHNGYPTSEIVMSAANSSRNGAMNLAPAPDAPRLMRAPDAPA